MRNKIEEAEGYASIRAALEGDYHPLEARLLSGAELRMDERAFLADHLCGRIVRNAARPPDTEKRARRYRAGQVVSLIRRVTDRKREAAIVEVAEMHGLSEEDVKKGCREFNQHMADDCLRKASHDHLVELVKGFRSGTIDPFDLPLIEPPPLPKNIYLGRK